MSMSMSMMHMMVMSRRLVVPMIRVGIASLTMTGSSEGSSSRGGRGVRDRISSFGGMFQKCVRQQMDL